MVRLGLGTNADYCAWYLVRQELVVGGAVTLLTDRASSVSRPITKGFGPRASGTGALDVKLEAL